MNPPVCPACGARLAPGATQCDLCGHVLGEEKAAAPESTSTDPTPTSSAPTASEPTPASEPASDTAPEDAPPEESLNGPFCVHCGAKNPDYARFCHKCGHALHTADVPEGSVPVVQATPVVPAAEAETDSPALPPEMPAGERPDSDPGKRALTLVGVAVVAVLALFFISQISWDDAPAAPQQAANTATPPPAPSTPTVLPDDVLAEVERLEGEIEAASTEEERLEAQEQLAGLYAQAGAFDRAAPLQQEVAEGRQTALAWADAGSLFLAHMLRTQGPERADYAQRAAENYERSLALNPDDLDVKTDLATAYLNDATNPMRAVEVVKEVLETNPDHVRANFNYGLMLAQINRTEQAQTQFEKVVNLTDPADPVHQRAEQELARVRAAQSSTVSS
jgi:cytochrome c-type biogenesis protein CcmH/NrfG/ribosomal protein L40E